MGTPITDPVIIAMSQPSKLDNGDVRGEVVYVDGFGNLISDIPEAWLAGRQWVLSCAGQEILGPSPSYASAQPGELLALISSNGTLEIAVRDGSAAALLAHARASPSRRGPATTKHRIAGIFSICRAGPRGRPGGQVQDLPYPGLLRRYNYCNA